MCIYFFTLSLYAVKDRVDLRSLAQFRLPGPQNEGHLKVSSHLYLLLMHNMPPPREVCSGRLPKLSHTTGGFHSRRIRFEVPCVSEFFGWMTGMCARFPDLYCLSWNGGSGAGHRLTCEQWGLLRGLVVLLTNLPVKVCHSWPGSKGALSNSILVYVYQGSG